MAFGTFLVDAGLFARPVLAVVQMGALLVALILYAGGILVRPHRERLAVVLAVAGVLAMTLGLTLWLMRGWGR